MPRSHVPCLAVRAVPREAEGHFRRRRFAPPIHPSCLYGSGWATQPARSTRIFRSWLPAARDGLRGPAYQVRNGNAAGEPHLTAARRVGIRLISLKTATARRRSCRIRCGVKSADKLDLSGDGNMNIQRSLDSPSDARHGGAAVAAERANAADAAERRDQATVRSLLKGGVDVNATRYRRDRRRCTGGDHDDAETAAFACEAGATSHAAIANGGLRSRGMQRTATRRS